MQNKEKKLIIVGDPIEDIYATIQNGKTIKTVTLSGGAANTYQNAKAIISKTNLFHEIYFVPELKFTNKHLYKILRLNDQPDIHLCEAKNKTNYYSDSQYIVQKQLNLLLDRTNYHSVIIFSDYDKGTLNLRICKYKGIDKIKLAIVDSKYSSLHSSLFDFADNYIWRCTGSEYNIDFAKNFNYTIWTDGPKAIKLLDRNQNILDTFEVSQIDPVDTCGAGDTFTAAIGAYLFFNQSLEIKNIKSAIRFAIRASLNVVTKSKTSITDIII